ncbi:TOBE domain-containing protein [Roseomonas sp. CCTCC AB2023176]|uniref:TOBE domain-containing protein n=1 Tax=Roseomonas sp. CCTCC AB2023176 TaxID=3342640 RepID=UPI0035DCDC1D
MLLDDPLGGLPDAAARAPALRRALRELGLTVLHATRDPAVAFALSDRVAVMEAGRVRQVGTPRALYDAPADAVVAALSGEANLLPGTVSSRDDDSCVLRLDGGLEAIGQPVGDLAPGARAILLIRPEDVAVAALSAEEMGEDAVPAVLLDAAFAGAEARLRLRLEDGTEILARRPAHLPLPQPGGEAAVAWDAGTARVLPE